MNADKLDYSKAIKFADEYMKKREQRYKKVKTVDYFNWLCSFIDNLDKHSFTDEDFDYKDNIPKEDKERVNLLSYFISYIDDLALEQRVLNATDDDNPYETINYDIKIYDNYYNVSQMHGQGSVSFISKLEQKPNHCFVNIIDKKA